jgi:hypothetical protein
VTVGSDIPVSLDMSIKVRPLEISRNWIILSLLNPFLISILKAFSFLLVKGLPLVVLKKTDV